MGKAILVKQFGLFKNDSDNIEQKVVAGHFMELSKNMDGKFLK